MARVPIFQYRPESSGLEWCNDTAPWQFHRRVFVHIALRPMFSGARRHRWPEFAPASSADLVSFRMGHRQRASNSSPATPPANVRKTATMQAHQNNGCVETEELIWLAGRVVHNRHRRVKNIGPLRHRKCTVRFVPPRHRLNDSIFAIHPSRWDCSLKLLYCDSRP
jgi:hypothetical protein